jgi:hypothetical protein
MIHSEPITIDYHKLLQMNHAVLARTAAKVELAAQASRAAKASRQIESAKPLEKT